MHINAKEITYIQMRKITHYTHKKARTLLFNLVSKLNGVSIGSALLWRHSKHPSDLAQRIVFLVVCVNSFKTYMRW
jgi:hypothetical protein